MRNSIALEDLTPYTNEERARVQDEDEFEYARALAPAPTVNGAGDYTTVKRYWKPERGTHIAATGNEEPGSYVYRLTTANIHTAYDTPYGPEFCNAQEARETYTILAERGLFALR